MYITVHSAFGAAAGQIISQPLLAFVIGFALHFLFDIIPHGDEGLKNWKLFRTRRKRIVAAASLDFVGVMIMTSIWLKNADITYIPSMLAGIAGAIAPDALWGLYELTGTPILRWYYNFHKKLHHVLTKKELTMKQGFVYQGIVLLVLTWIITSS
tara:strand:- start:61 stop:525 length:465 start_codon:yes stop_codon:yes gene_type:complete